MRRKQLYAIILAGALAAGSAPAAVFAAESDVATTAETSEEAPVEGDTAAESPADTTTEAPAQDTAETPADTTTEAPAQDTTAATEAPAEQTQEQTAEETPVAETTEAPAAGDEQSTESGVYINIIPEGQTEPQKVYCDSIQDAITKVEAVDANADIPAIYVEKNQEISETVNISGKRVSIYATEDVTISRKAGFEGDLFTVEGEESKLQLKAADGKTLTINGDNNSVVSEGSIISVKNKATLEVYSSVVLTGNETDEANGGAITNDNGVLMLAGGTIKENTGKLGAVYSNTTVNVMGDVTISENTAPNLYLDGDAVINVTGVMKNASIAVTHAKAADKLKIVTLGTQADGTAVADADFKEAVGKITYDDTAKFKVELDSDGKTASLVGQKTTPDNPDTPTTPDLTVTPNNIKWQNHTTANITLTINWDGYYYYKIVDKSKSLTDLKKEYDASKATNNIYADTKITIPIENIPDGSDFRVAFYAKTSSGDKYDVVKLNLSTKSRPDAGTATRDARKYKVSESTITGLDSSMKFFPGKFYDFSVTGAGQNDTDPITGDERWIPIYWSTAKNPTTKQQNTTWRIGSGKGIKDGDTFTMYIFFKKQTYNGGKWNDTDTIQSMAVKFTAASISDDEWNAYIAELSGTPSNGDGNGSGGSGSGGDGTDAELTATAAASEKDAGSKSKSAVSTADESPIGTMSALAALSLLAGGYIVVRKRKKEEL